MDQRCGSDVHGVATVTSPAEFRGALAHFATGVTIVAAFDGQARPRGLTVNSFTSVSLDPPLVLVCVHPHSQAYAAVVGGGRFGVSILGAEQEALSRRFAISQPGHATPAGPLRFDGVRYHRGEQVDVPLIEGALVQLECATCSVHPEGDHTIVVGRVVRTHVNGGRPLLYYRGRYRRLGAEADG